MANKQFGNKLRELRNEKKYTQQQVADMLGLKNKSTLGSWEVGKSEPDGYTLLKLCKIYEVKDIYTTFDETSTLQCTTGSINTELYGFKNGISNYSINKDIALEINHHETNVITAYRQQPSMQPAVDKILGVERQAPDVYEITEELSPSNEEIEKELAAYRMELEAEQNGRMFSAYGNTNTNVKKAN